MSAPVADLSSAVADRLLIRAGVTARQDRPTVGAVRSGNRVFSISTAAEDFFVKFPAKDFVSGVEPVIQAAGRVVAEAAAAELLRRRDLPSVEVIAVEANVENPAAWPYLLMRAVAGRPLIDLVREPRPHEALFATGTYLAAMHSIRFDISGYIVTPEGPAPDPCQRPSAGRHDPAVLREEALADLAKARPNIRAATFERAWTRLDGIADEVRAEYDSPCFVHSALHPNHPFVSAGTVSGLIDLDNASAGAAFDDLLTIGLGLMIQTPDVRWWEPFFDGYGSPPDLERFRIGLLSCAHYCFGDDRGQPLDDTYEALLRADNWAALFHSHRTTT